jgi:hypothetical protein
MGDRMNSEAGATVEATESGSDQQRGAVLPLMAIMLVVLIGTAAMAVDLGWLYWQSVEIQHGADAAALAGVIYEPDLRAEAKTAADETAIQNGYDDSNPGTTVTVVDFVDDDTSVVRESMLRVTITQQIDTFFLKIFGMSDFDISRTAVAEYVQPLSLGSPESYFGDDPADEIYPGFVAKVDGSYIGKAGGERFGSLCLNDGFGADCLEEVYCGGGPASRALNPEGRQAATWGTTSATGGYLYAIEVEESSSAGLTVEIFSGPVYAVRKYKGSTAPSTGTGNFHGDNKQPKSQCGGDKWNVEARTWFMLYGPDPTPSDTTDGNELLCSVAYDERMPVYSPYNNDPPNSSAYNGDFGGMGWDDSWLEFDEVRADGHQDILDAMWDDMGNSLIADYESAGCSSSFDKGPGIYVLRVFNQHDDSGETNIEDSWRGSNSYSLRVSSAGGTQPTISAIEDMVMVAARNTTQTEFYLAKVDSKYAGKDLIIELWDVGDITEGPSSDSFTIKDGTGTAVDCEWVATDTSPVGKPNPTSGGSGECTINASDKVFNDELITMIIPIPESYTCTGNGCWWKVTYDYVGLVKDTTTWTAYVDGNPIRLVE